MVRSRCDRRLATERWYYSLRVFYTVPLTALPPCKDVWCAGIVLVGYAVVDMFLDTADCMGGGRESICRLTITILRKV